MAKCEKNNRNNRNENCDANRSKNVEFAQENNFDNNRNNKNNRNENCNRNNDCK